MTNIAEVHSNNVSSWADRDWGKWVVDNRNTVILGTFVVLASVFGGGYYFHQKKLSKVEYNSRIYTFTSNELAQFETDKDGLKLIKAYKLMYKDVGNYLGLIPVSLKTADVLIKNGKTSEALEILQMSLKLNSNIYAQYFVKIRMGVVYEDMGKFKEAIDVLLDISKSDADVFKGKTYLDLGRNYLKIGDKEKAKSSFEFVINKANSDLEFVKMAKLYLAEVK